jgi:hypothetical protein
MRDVIAIVRRFTHNPFVFIIVKRGNLMTYIYRSRVGVFFIVPNNQGGWWLGVDDERLGHFLSPQAAADAVYMQATGHYDWDCFPSVSGPTDLSEWERFA